MPTDKTITSKELKQVIYSWFFIFTPFLILMIVKFLTTGVEQLILTGDW